MKAYNRHKFFWKLVRILTPAFIKPLFNFSCEEVKDIDAPYLVLANHNCDLDPVFLGYAFPQQMYFVASEHVYRAGIASHILRFVFEPIAKRKGTSDALTVMKAIRTLREGKNVCLFPEGQKSFNGLTGEIHIATGKLVKASKANLVTYKFQGGYFTTPRWGKGIRKGKVTGKLVNFYTKEQLDALSAEEITERIKQDLYEDAYERQEESPIKYKTKKIAEGLESALCVCPSCNNIDSLCSKKNVIVCKECGLTATLDNYYYFNNNKPFKTITEWDFYQQNFIKEMVHKNSDSSESIFYNQKVTLKSVKAEHKEETLGTGIFLLYNDRFVFQSKEKTFTFNFDTIEDISMFGRQSLVFSDTQKNYYELTSKEIINVRKYIFYFKFWQEQNTK